MAKEYLMMSTTKISKPIINQKISNRDGILNKKLLRHKINIFKMKIKKLNM